MEGKEEHGALTRLKGSIERHLSSQVLLPFGSTLHTVLAAYSTGPTQPVLLV